MILQNEMESVEFLRNLGDRYLNQVARMAKLMDCAEGTTLFTEGQTSRCTYLVLSGTVSLEVEESDGELIEVGTAGAGDLLGWLPVLGRSVMTATARTVTRCRLAALDAATILELCERDPRFGMAFLRQVSLALSERLSKTRHSLALARTINQRSASLIGAE